MTGFSFPAYIEGVGNGIMLAGAGMVAFDPGALSYIALGALVYLPGLVMEISARHTESEG